MAGLSKDATRRIHAAVDLLYDRVIHRFLQKPSQNKQIVIGWKPRVTLPQLFVRATAGEGVRPDATVLRNLLEVAESYLEAQRDATKARVTNAVQSFLQEARASGVKTDVGTVLGGQLTKEFGRAADAVEAILDTEATKARNVGTLDAILKIAAVNDIEDPTVYFIVVRDQHLCEECRRLHLQEDGVTPRLWKMSQLGHGYHQKGEDNPKVGGLHPHCFAAGTRLHTDRGLLTVEELFAQGGDLKVAVDGRVKNRRVGNNQFGRELAGDVWFHRHSSGSRMLAATHVYDTGIQECFRITLDTGVVLEVSAGHEMWVDDGRVGLKVRADTLVVGDKVPLLSGPGGFGKDSFPELAELMGNLMGDGVLGDTALWHFFGDDIEYGHRLKELASRFSSRLTGPMAVSPPDGKYKVQHCVFNSQVLARMFIDEFGLSKRPRRVPSLLWSADKITVAAFLRGLYAADGHSEDAPAVVLAQNDLEFLREIQLLLSNFGLRARIFEHGQEVNKVITYADGTSHETSRKACWRLHLGGWDQVSVFAKEIGLGVPVKQARLMARLMATEGRSRLGAWRTAKVESIQRIGPKQTYCLTEPMTNTVTANGVVTGQCRCQLVTLAPGYGFDAGGHVEFKKIGYDAHAEQQK